MSLKTERSMIAIAQGLAGTIILGVSLSLGATEPFPYSLFPDDDILNLEHFSKDLEKRFDEKNAFGEAKYNMLREVDRSKIALHNPMFNLHAIGKVTIGDASGVESLEAIENINYGTGTMISPCHMITNRHVVCTKVMRDGKNACVKNENILGKSVNFSYGEDPKTKKPLGRTVGIVVAQDPELDFAIARIDSLKDKSNVPYVVPAFKGSSIFNDSVCIGVGFPLASRDESNARPYGTKSKITEKIDERGGHWRIDAKMTLLPGMSGMLPICLYRDGDSPEGRLIAAGIANSSDNDISGNPSLNADVNIFSFREIGSHLKAFDNGIYTEIRKAIVAGKCD